jgi:uncharacterized OsmC-like protein
MSATVTESGTDISNKVAPHVAPTSSQTLFVSPHARRDGFWASIRGHVLDLADPGSGHALAPTPNDLFIVSVASELAWTARTILRVHGLPDDVSVSANWRTQDEHGDRPSLADIDLTVTVSIDAKAASAALAAALENSLVARSLAEPVAHISWEGAKR